MCAGAGAGAANFQILIAMSEPAPALWGLGSIEYDPAYSGYFLDIITGYF